MSSITSPVTSPTSTSSDHTSDTMPSRRRSRVSAEHTLNRVRENQRRHRARQRDHVATLEAKLAETEKLLVEARAEIAFLKGQQEASSIACSSDIPENLATSSVGQDMDGLNKQSELVEYLANPDFTFLGDANPPAFIIDIDSLQLPLPLPAPAAEELDSFNGPPPCCSDPTAVTVLNEPVDPECSTCKTKPPPDPSESTTLCAQAFVLISQQNFRNLDPATIRMWLAQGLRRAQREGEGCRVENGALLRLLDYISGI